ncbi:tautomerase family protein [Secundilactobacillus folii]|uniref:4-oxalocrotonate tautomerase n=1 Tax=Secundilactobacillus folii TaxID=2678357 RepID=A0A7X2XTH6_9LACO|nr:4-oxalocrotonate tautomerase [Secundilactobacillus folii]MTV81383.1 4-oxalocrotonate tautomerase [Secundilactobacillus folii]
MPYLRVRIASSDQKRVTTTQVAKMLTDLAVTKLGKSASDAAVDVRFTDPDNWFIGGQPVSQNHATSFFIEIKITASTNSRTDKSAFVQAAFDGMSKLFSNISKTSYIVLHDVASDSWGYGGKTQEYRYITGDKEV